MNPAPEDTIITSCPGCGKNYRIDRHLAGKRIRCKTCQAVWSAQAAGAQGPDLQASDISIESSQLGSAAGSTDGANQKSAPWAATAEPDHERTWIGHKLGKFQILDLLGKGAMGVVFAAHDPDLNRNVALKILAKQLVRDRKRTYRLEQFAREARSAARLSHPNSVIVHEIGQDHGWYFIAMELVEGGTLLDLLRKKKRKIPIEHLCELIAQAADALSAAHKLGVIHRDVKPSNLMLTKEGRVKVADFGLAQLAEPRDDFELPTKAVGTPYWMSPEQCKGETAVPQSDIYSLGAVLYYALTGEVPYRGKTKRDILTQHVNAPVPDPRRLRRDIPETLVRIIRRAMAKLPGQRYQDAGEMAIGLRQIAAKLTESKMAERWYGRAASVGTTSSPVTTTGWASPFFKALVLLGILLVIIGGLLYWRSLRPASQPQLPPSGSTQQPVPAAPEHVPVYALKRSATLTYHAKGCEAIQGASEDHLQKYSSEEEAQKAGLTACRYCVDLLKEQKKALHHEPATKGPTHRPDTAPPQEKPSDDPG